MATFTVRKGKRYRADIRLGLFQSVASNQQVADQFSKVGFTEVSVTGSGRNRVGTGLWPHPDATAEVPDEITTIEVIET
ncbi:hypothetical protein [Methyloceanibacter sp.]|uniref:hypothetical protein n=1 Tax=Methyloceanibacter sp. TaxID=1965321 RepID=UPI002D4A50DC|nr:hypothetical protein [Methyloceanibacter sp.]HZP10255.1 hypothetical protein [Methyloceanibacter sp.]